MMPIYFLRAGNKGPVKVGYAINPEKRAAELQTGHYETLQLIRTMDGNRAAEGWLHKYFAEHKVRGEWFAFDEMMLSVSVPPLPPPVESPKNDHYIRPTNQATRIIDKFGGTRALARAISIAPSTVQSWKDSGFVPAQHQQNVLDAAKRAAVPLGPEDFFENGSDDA